MGKTQPNLNIVKPNPFRLNTMSGAGVKQIEAIVSSAKFPSVDKALRALGVSGATMVEAKGRGRDQIITTSLVRGRWSWTTDVVHRVIVNVVVDASDVDKVVDAIVKAASTNKVGDGKIFVYPIERAIDISTGQSDDHTLNPARAVKKG
jgi:nitrogen regulatory protein PII